MIIDKIIPYNFTFWNYLDSVLKVQFTENGYSYNWIYPLKDLNYSIFTKTKKRLDVSVDVRIIFNIDKKDKEYLGKLIFGKISQKNYVNTKGSDLTKCFPNSEFSKWIKIDEHNKIIEIRLN